MYHLQGIHVLSTEKKVAVSFYCTFYFWLRKVIAKIFIEFNEHMQGQYPGKNKLAHIFCLTKFPVHYHHIY